MKYDVAMDFTKENPAFSVSKDLHPSREHRPQHVIVLGQRSKGRVMQRSTDVQFDILKTNEMQFLLLIVAVLTLTVDPGRHR